MGPPHLFNPFAHLPTLNPIRLADMAGFVSRNDFKLSDTPDLSGRVAAVTGGQMGLGKEIVLQLLLHGISKVFVLARREEKFIAARAEWAAHEALEEGDVERRAEFVRCDLSDVVQVAQAAEVLVSKAGGRLDILVNNAGLANVPDYTLSPQGVETIFATNHVGHFALTLLVLPLLERTAVRHGSARVAVTSSSLHLVCQELDLALVTAPARTKSPAVADSLWRYGRSKLANILFARELAARLEKKDATGVYVNSFFPGNTPTDGMDNWKATFGNALGSLIKGSFSVVGQTPQQAAATAVYLAASKDVEIRGLKGRYFVPIAHENTPSKTATDGDLARNLWYWTDNKVAETLGKEWQEKYEEA